MRTESLILRDHHGKPFLAAFWVLRPDDTVDHWHWASDGKLTCEFLADSSPGALTVFRDLLDDAKRPCRRSDVDRRSGRDRRDWKTRRTRKPSQPGDFGRRAGFDRRKS